MADAEEHRPRLAGAIAAPGAAGGCRRQRAPAGRVSVWALVALLLSLALVSTDSDARRGPPAFLTAPSFAAAAPFSAGVEMTLVTPGGRVPLDHALVATTAPEIAIRLGRRDRGRHLSVVLTNLRRDVPDTDVTHLFRGLLTDGKARAVVPMIPGTNTLRVSVYGGGRPALGTATLLSFDRATPVVTTPVRHPFIRGRGGEARIQARTLILNFENDRSLEAMSEVLRHERLTPVGLVAALKRVVVQLAPWRKPEEVADRLSARPDYGLEAVLPNILMELDTGAGEALPPPLVSTYRAGGAADCSEAGDEVRGCFPYERDNGNPPDALFVFRQHFLLDTFAGHRLVEHLVGNPPRVRAGDLAVIDTGIGRGGRRANPTDIDDGDFVRITGVVNGVGLTTQRMTRRGAVDLTLADIRDERGPNGHGTAVISAAAGRGAKVLGPGRHVRIRPMKPEVEDEGVDHNTVVEALNLAIDDADVAVINTSFGRRLGRIPQNRQQDYIDDYRDTARRTVRAGKIWVASAGNDGLNTTAAQDRFHLPSDLAPGPGPRGRNDPLLMAVSASGLAGVFAHERGITAPEQLWEDSNFGRRISVAAPGEDVYLVGRNGRISDRSGTSHASPHVAGLAAEMIHLDHNIRRRGRFSPLQVIELIEATADDLGSEETDDHDAKPNDQPGNGHDAQAPDLAFGHGRINVWKALLAVANGGVAGDRGSAFPSLRRRVVAEGRTTWYGFKVITPAPGATAWVDGTQVTDDHGTPAATLPDANPAVSPGNAQAPKSRWVSAYAGVRSDQVILAGIDDDGDGVLDEDPTSGVVPVGNRRGEYVMTFSMERRRLAARGGKTRTLSLRTDANGDGRIDLDDPPFFNLELHLAAMRAGAVPGVAFDDFVFEVTASDFPDAPTRYPTRLADGNAARHLNTHLEWLAPPVTDAGPALRGLQGVSPETDADDAADVDGQPNVRGDPDLDRHDNGVVFYPLTYLPGDRGEVRFTVHVADADSGRYAADRDRELYANLWIDWDTNGRWEEAAAKFEHVVDGLRLNPARFASKRQRSIIRGLRHPRGRRRDDRTNVDLVDGLTGAHWATFRATFRLPPQLGTGEIWARMRLDYGEDAGRNDPRPETRAPATPLFRSDPTLRDPALVDDPPAGPGNPPRGFTHGAARFGEVEDYLIGTDFGDAPDGGYPTRKASAGGRHLDIHQEWLQGSKTREPDACLTPQTASADVDGITNLGPPGACGEDDKDAAEEAVVTWDGEALRVNFTARSTIASRGYDLMGHDDDGARRVMVKSLDPADPGCARQKDFAVWSTPPASGGKGRYHNTAVDDDRDGAMDEDPVDGADDDGDGLIDEDPPGTRPLVLNIFVDWNNDGQWGGPGEWVARNVHIAPETFGAGGGYTLGEPFDDANHNGVRDQGEGFTDGSGEESQAYSCKFSPPGEVEAIGWVRIRLGYAEHVDQTQPDSGGVDSERLVDAGLAHFTEAGRTAGDRLDKEKNGALFGEVEDYPPVTPTHVPLPPETVTPGTPFTSGPVDTALLPGEGPYRFALAPGTDNALPGGLTLSAETGAVSGVTETPGRFMTLVAVFDVTVSEDVPVAELWMTFEVPPTITVVKLDGDTLAPVAGWRIGLHAGDDCDGLPQQVAFTDPRGVAAFEGLDFATYAVAEALAAGVTPLTPACRTVDLSTFADGGPAAGAGPAADTLGPAVDLLRAIGFLRLETAATDTDAPGDTTATAGTAVLEPLPGGTLLDIPLAGTAVISRDAPADGDGDGRRDITTEMVEMSLAGVSPLGPLLVMEDPARRATGIIEEQTPGVFFPADSETHLHLVVGAAEGSWRTDAPLRLTGVVHALPPALSPRRTAPGLVVDLPNTAPSGAPARLHGFVWLPVPPWTQPVLFVNTGADVPTL